MSAPDHTAEEEADGHFAVRVGRHVAGYLIRDHISLRAWRILKPDRQFMGRYRDKAAAAAFLAAWFRAEEHDQ